ncbi:MAG TPA: hypothetical protein PK224_03620 [Nitrospira sp.]|nr:hypothetical protein [Nitrospira sp.]
MDTSPTPRPLTYDEKRASEAAFLGLPAHPSWTQGAQRIYVKLTQALAKKQPPTDLLNEDLCPRLSSLPAVNETTNLTPDRCQVWHLSLHAPAEQHLFVLDPQHPINDVVQTIETRWPGRAYQLDPVTCGVFALLNIPQEAFNQHPERQIIHSLIAPARPSSST